MKTGILKELKPEFIAVSQRKPSTYAGHPFIVETAIAYGGDIPKKDDIVVYRFANKIPLLYDEASDVSVRVIRSINWRRYKVALWYALSYYGSSLQHKGSLQDSG